MTTIAIYSDRAILALGLERTISATYHVETLGLDCISAASTPPGLAGGCPGAVILDTAPDAIQLIQKLRTIGCEAPVAVWERVGAIEPALNALALGVQGVLLDTSTQAEVLECLEAILRGEMWVPPAIAQAALLSRHCRLSKREGELVNLVALGLSNKEIAYTLGIAVGTVKVYLSRIFDKLGVSDRYELALLVLRQGGSAAKPAEAAGRAHDPQPEWRSGTQSVFVPRKMTDHWKHPEPHPKHVPMH
jgi:two-component system nitrate/nitrite response regulator NarP